MRRLLLILAVVGACAAASRPARAEDARAQLAQAMRSYFGGEKSGGLGFMGFGLASLAFGGVALWRGGRAFRAAGVTALALGAIQVAVGAVVYLRTDAQLAGLLRGLESDAARTSLAELLRIEKVRRTFTILKLAEIAVFVGGAAALAVGSRKDSPIAVGIGASLAAHAVIILVQDLFAAGRADVYSQALGLFRLSAGVVADPLSGALAGGLLGVGGVF